jgi:hypothetical protein
VVEGPGGSAGSREGCPYRGKNEGCGGVQQDLGMVMYKNYFKYLFVNRVFSISHFIVILLAALPACLFADNSPLTDSMAVLSMEVKEAALHQQKDWHYLLQYWKNIFYLTTSRVDDPEYFISEHGKRNPEAELLATLESFITVQDEDSDDNPQCVYPARFLWLNQKLGLLERGLVRQAPCERYVAWKESLAVKKIHLIFPAAYLNNPASMFGHTLFRLDSERSRNNPLLSYAANFGAATGADGGVLFAVKGLLGGYPASFSVEPYYETVKRYGDIEHRDIWEYELLLTEDEIERFLSLLWEIGNTYFDYYFFDENCSFYVLALLDFVRPELDLLSEFSYWVIPSDTLKAVTSREGLIGEKRYRPSLSTRLTYASEYLDSASLSDARNIARGKDDPKDMSYSETEERDARLLEYSYDYLEFLSSKGKVSEEDSRKRARSILSERSRLLSLEPLLIPEPDAGPEDTHPSGRVLLSAGGRERNAFTQLSVKPAYHDMLDTPDGFREGAAIDFFHVSFRHYEQGRFVLQSFYPVAIESYTPWSRVFTPVSWDVSAGLFREFVPKEHRKNLEGSLGGFLETSGGITLPLFSGVTLSSLVSVRGTIVPAYESENYALGAGPKARLTAPLTDRARWMTEGSLIRYPLGETHTYIRAKSEIQYDIMKDIFIRAGVGYERSFDIDIRESGAGFGWYF